LVLVLGEISTRVTVLYTIFISKRLWGKLCFGLTIWGWLVWGWGMIRSWWGSSWKTSNSSHEGYTNESLDHFDNGLR
jgi:hypothetical protein